MKCNKASNEILSQTPARIFNCNYSEQKETQTSILSVCTSLVQAQSAVEHM